MSWIEDREHAPSRRLTGLIGALSAILACGALGSFAPVQDTDRSQEERATLERESVVQALEDLAEWCHAHKLFAKRNEVFEVILRLEPDHSKAHRGLRHSLQKGQWTPPDRPYAPRDKSGPALEDFARKRAELLAPYGQAVMAMIAELELEPFEARELLEPVLLANPDDAAAHEFLGDVRIEGHWMLEESAAALRRRAELDSIWAGALYRARSAIKRSEPSAAEVALGVAWNSVVASDRVRVLGTVPEDEVQLAAAIAHAAPELFGALAPHPVETHPTIYMLDSENDKAVFLRNYPGLTKAERTFYRTLSGTTLPGGDEVVQWGESKEKRVDAVTRHAVDVFLKDTFRIEASQGWVYEGLGAYLTWRMTGTHSTWRVSAANRSDGGGGAVSMVTLFGVRNDDWLELASDLYCGPDRLELDIEGLLDKPIDGLSPADLLASYTLSAYLVESRGDVARLLHRIRSVRDSKAAMTKVLNKSVAELEWRVYRWLEQQSVIKELSDQPAGPTDEPGSATED